MPYFPKDGDVFEYTRKATYHGVFVAGHFVDKDGIREGDTVLPVKKAADGSIDFEAMDMINPVLVQKGSCKECGHETDEEKRVNIDVKA